MSKPLMTVTLSRRMFDGTIVLLQVVEVSQLGNLNVLLGHNDINEPYVESAEIQPSQDFVEIVKESHLTLKEAHQKMVEAQYAFQHAMTDMFAIKKYIDGST